MAIWFINNSGFLFFLYTWHCISDYQQFKQQFWPKKKIKLLVTLIRMMIESFFQQKKFLGDLKLIGSNMLHISLFNVPYCICIHSNKDCIDFFYWRQQMWWFAYIKWSLGPFHWYTGTIIKHPQSFTLLFIDIQVPLVYCYWEFKYIVNSFH